MYIVRRYSRSMEAISLAANILGLALLAWAATLHAMDRSFGRKDAWKSEGGNERKASLLGRWAPASNGLWVSLHFPLPPSHIIPSQPCGLDWCSVPFLPTLVSDACSSRASPCPLGCAVFALGTGRAASFTVTCTPPQAVQSDKHCERRCLCAACSHDQLAIERSLL
jgi:hypothetical protein